MITTKTTFYSLAMAFATVSLNAHAQKVKAPEPIAPLPAEKQVAWQQLETYAFIHYGLNTYNDREWGYGDSDPKTFNPKHLDCEQWVKTLKAAGLKGVILTAKHHDGFCLWPFAETTYNISATPWRDGKGDLVGELAAACRKHGLKLGLYLSPWDRNQSTYGSQAYIDYYYRQLNDLMTRYGDLFEMWFDGANGGDGYYGGAKETRSIDRRTYYNFPKINQMVAEKQPGAVIFSDGGPGCRWVGNEKGYANATNWAFLRGKEVYPGYPDYPTLQSGHADGDQWTASECNFSIRPGWFYHPEEDDKVKTPEQLVDLYYRSVGHNGTMNINFPVDRDGLIHPIDSANAVRFHQIIQAELAHNLVEGMTPKVTNSRGGEFTPQLMTDGKYDTYWATRDGATTADITFSFKKLTRVNRLLAQEYIRLGQRVKAFTIEYSDGKKWLPVEVNEETTTIGYKRIVRFRSVMAKAVRLRITDARGPLCISNIEMFDAGPRADASITASAKALASLPYTVLGVDEAKAQLITDGNDATTATVDGGEIVIDLGKATTIESFHYLPDQSEAKQGLISHYELAVGDAPDAINTVVKSGEFSNIKNNPVMQSLYFTPVSCRYIRLKATKMIVPGQSIGVAGIVVK